MPLLQGLNGNAFEALPPADKGAVLAGNAERLFGPWGGALGGGGLPSAETKVGAEGAVGSGGVGIGRTSNLFRVMLI